MQIKKIYQFISMKSIGFTKESIKEFLCCTFVGYLTALFTHCRLGVTKCQNNAEMLDFCKFSYHKATDPI